MFKDLTTAAVGIFASTILRVDQNVRYSVIRQAHLLRNTVGLVQTIRREKTTVSVRARNAATIWRNFETQK